MKKSINYIAAGLIFAPLMANADSTVYGEAQFRLTDAKNQDLNAEMSTTRLGIKGTVDNHIEGLVTAYQLEWDLSADAGLATDPNSTSDVAVRKSLVFLKGDWGQATFGRQNNPAEIMDMGFAGKHGQSFSLTPDRYGNAISYATLPRGGFELAGGVAMDVGDTEKDDVDAAALAFSYNNYGINAALAWFDVTDTYSITGGKFIYSTGSFSVGANYQEKDFDATASNDITVITAGGNYIIGNTTLYAEYQQIDEDAGETNDNDVSIVGVGYALGQKAKISLEYAQYEKDTGSNGRNDGITLEYGITF